MAPSSAEKNASSITTLDPDGDCFLSVLNRNSVTRFLVSSSVLSLASPAFRTYFKSLDPASKPYDFTVLAPEKYDDLSLGLLMQICHFQRASPIPFVPLERLYNLAITAHKFCLVTPVEPWVTIWTTPLICDLAFKDPHEIEMWLSIASVFNQEQMFQRVTQKAILSYTSEFLGKIDSGSLHRAVVGKCTFHPHLLLKHQLLTIYRRDPRDSYHRHRKVDYASTLARRQGFDPRLYLYPA